MFDSDDYATLDAAIHPFISEKKWSYKHLIFVIYIYIYIYVNKISTSSLSSLMLLSVIEDLNAGWKAYI